MHNWETALPGFDYALLYSWLTHLQLQFACMNSCMSSNDTLLLKFVATPCSSGEALRDVHGMLDMSDGLWDCISPDAKSLLRHLMHRSASRRITAAKALQHPLLTGRARNQVLPYLPSIMMVSKTIPFATLRMCSPDSVVCKLGYTFQSKPLTHACVKMTAFPFKPHMLHHVL